MPYVLKAGQSVSLPAGEVEKVRIPTGKAIVSVSGGDKAADKIIDGPGAFKVPDKGQVKVSALESSIIHFQAPEPTPEIVEEKEELKDEQTYDELYAEATKKKIRGRSTMNKDELAAALAKKKG